MRVKDARQTFLGVWLRRIVEGRPIQVYGDGTQLRDFNFVDDVVDALLKAAASDQANGQIFNLGSPEPISLKDLAALLLEIAETGVVELIPFPPDVQRIDIGDYFADFGHIHTVLGWSPQTSLRDGLETTLKFYRTHSRYYWSETD
jgi:nucleoside-diphosphate-sugar epimerase